uniref:Uncharacterized protein n=1 Tax=Ananas comosus var. bracteatus TaxID=296719 RepID=A0A6V7PTE0_ANACO|nr:unnamed protein product [Ananas comosus var. bracteatus]
MESNGPQKTPVKSLWHVVRAVYYMLLKGVWKRSLALDLHLLFKRGKIAGGRALSGLLTAHHHHHHHHNHERKTAAFDVAAFSSAFSCRSMDAANAVYAPREVEFSCNNTPSFPFLHRKDRHQHRHRHHRHGHRDSGSSRRDSTLYSYDAAAIAKVFEVLNSDSSPSTSTSPALFARSPHRVRQLRVTDSPFPEELEEEEEDLEVGGGGVDMEAEEFIRWFREQLRSQTHGTTPEYGYGDHWL